jgi:hypothetical protein
MYINNFMNYLTNHYRNLCEQYQSKINILQNLLNEDAPASTFSGTGQGQQTFSDEQLRDQMKQNKRSNAFGPAIPDDKQNQAYRDAQAELARRQGASAKVELDPSIKQSSDYKTDRVAGDWVERYAQKLGEDPRKIEAMRRGVIDTLGGDAGKPMDTSMTSNQVAQRGVDAYKRAQEYAVGLQNQAKEAAPSSTPSSAPTTSAQPVKSLEVYDRQLEVEKARQGSGEAQPVGPGRKGAKPSQTAEPTAEPTATTRNFSTFKDSPQFAERVAKARERGFIPDNPDFRGNRYLEGEGTQGVYGSEDMRNPNVLDAWNQLKNPLAAKFFKNKALLSLTRPQKDSTKNEPSASDNPEPTPATSLNSKEVTDTIMKLTGMNQNTPEPDATETKIPEMGRAQSRRTTYVVPESEAWNNLTTEEQHEMMTSAISNNEVHKFFGGRLADTAFDKESGKMGFTTNPENFRFSEDNSGQTPEETARLNRQAKMLNQMMAEREKQGQRDTQQRKAREAELSGQTISTGGMNQPMDLADFPDDEDTDKQSSSAELENARKLAQMYANRMGRRYSKAPTPTPTPVPPKDQEIILSKDKSTMDQNNLDKLFLRLYGAEKFNTMSPKQRNLMLMQYNQSKVKR